MIRFGTDGIRGEFGKDLTLDVAYKCGNALSGNVVVGIDTRDSGEKLAEKFAEGIVDAGGNVTFVGVCPTSGVAFLTRNFGYDFGAVITASHNPSEYNGIKIFAKNGKKIDSGCEKLIEKHINNHKISKSNQKGNRIDNFFLVEKYINFLTKKICDLDLSKLKIVLDCANGATSKIGPSVFKKLGAQISFVGCMPNGKNINENCGSLHTEVLQKEVLKQKADMGFAFDGDGDRLIAVDENGDLVDGDMLLYLFALEYLKSGKLKERMVVGTTMTNLGVEKALNEKGVCLVRVDVGDKFINEKLEKENLLLGAEQSGHILMKDKHITGDGILSALFVCEICLKNNKKLNEFFDFEKYKQTTKNVLVKNKDEVFDKLKDFIEKQNKSFTKQGRLLVRKSGTEPLIRIMVESKDEVLNDIVADKIKQEVIEIEKKLKRK